MTEPIKRDASCMDDFDPNSMDAKLALQLILEQMNALDSVENVPIREALNRTLAENITSNINVPGHTNSAMDGYAIISSDIPSEGLMSLNNIGTAWAGRPYQERVNPGECIRIMTGAAMPEGTDTVVMQEHVKKEGANIHIDQTNQPGQNVRQA